MTGEYWKTLLRRGLPALALVLLLGGCAENAPQDALDPAGELARDIDNLFMGVFWVALAVFVVVEAAFVYAIFRFRQRPGDDEELSEMPEQVHGNTRLEVGWTIVPALILAAVAVFTVPVIFQLADPDEAASLEVQVTAQKYWFGFEYGDEGIVTANELHMPAGEMVKLTLESTDVIHSFWAPRLNGKRDIVPGRTHTWFLKADEPGVYAGQCGEFCGLSHAFMRLKVVAHDRAGWEEWLDDHREEPVEPTSGLAADGFELFEQKGCAGCHRVAGQYETVADTSPAAPDLTHLFDRTCFAGCIYDLEDRTEMEAWLRDPQRKPGSLMVIGELNEQEIDALYAYLETLD